MLFIFPWIQKVKWGKRARVRARERSSNNNNKNKNNNGTGFTCVLHTHFSEEEHPCINQRTTNTERSTTQQRKVDRASEWAESHASIVFAIFGLYLSLCFLCSHTRSPCVHVSHSAAHTQTQQQPIRHQPYSHSLTHFHAHREKDLSRALAVSLSLLVVHSFILCSTGVRFNVPTTTRKTDTQTSIIASIVHGISIERFYNRNLTVVFTLVVCSENLSFFGSDERILNFFCPFRAK